MSKHRSLINNTFLYAIGPFLNSVLSVILIPYYSFHFTTAELGYYDLIVTSGSIVIAISTLKISDALYRWLIDSEQNINKKISAVSNSFFIIIVSFVLLIFGFWLFGKNIQYPQLVCTYILSTILLTHFQQLLRGSGYLKIYSWLAFINCFLIIVFNFLFLGYLHYKLKGVMLAIIFANIISIACIVLKVDLFKFIKFNAVNKLPIKEMISYTSPLVFNAINLWFLGGFDRYVIVTYLGLNYSGIYAVAIKFSSILLLLNSFFILAWQDFILVNKNVRGFQFNFNNFFNKYVVLQFSIAVFFIAISKFVFLFFIDIKFIDAWKYLPILLLGFSFQGFTSFLGTLFLIEKNTKMMFKTTLAGGVVNIAVSLILVSYIALYAPAVGLLAGFMVTFLIRYLLLKNKMELKLNKPHVILMCMFFIVITAMVNSASKILMVISILSSIIVIFLANKKLWMQLFDYFLNLINFKKTTKV